MQVLYEPMIFVVHMKFVQTYEAWKICDALSFS
jgi:hypothetical protein